MLKIKKMADFCGFCRIFYKKLCFLMPYFVICATVERIFAIIQRNAFCACNEIRAGAIIFVERILWWDFVRQIFYSCFFLVGGLCRTHCMRELVNVGGREICVQPPNIVLSNRYGTLMLR